MENLNRNSSGHEVDDADVRMIGLTGLGLAILIAIVFALVSACFQFLVRHPVKIEHSSPLTETDHQQFPPTPRIEDHPANELHELRTQEERTLSTYGWVDRSAGVVRIPLDRAMELQLQRGYPARKEAVTK